MVKPYLRWWWLLGPFRQADIRRQLAWVRDAGFGGVELAWIYPSWYEESERGSRPEWLGPEWSELVAFTKAEADSLELGCDFTFGSCWPFGGSWVTAENASQTFDGVSDQRLGCSWEKEALIVNHLSASALELFAEPLLTALKPALAGSTSALFCDSLELATERLWTAELWDRFEAQFGYSLRPVCDALNEHADIRYDYRKLIAATIRREFYEAFTRLCHSNGAYSRAQCHGAPTDLLAAYASVDVPESEALLFPPEFSRIAASAAAWSDKRVVSAETFTCIYGFPGWDESAERYWRKETIGDLKLLADALFANGVNRIVWHGMPYQPAGEPVEFYASVHVAPDSPFSAELPSFNAYLTQVSSLLQSGSPYGELGIYLPYEDACMQDRLPEEERIPGANYRWEMRHAKPPAETEGFAPVWISRAFLEQASIVKGAICSRELTLSGLYIDCEWLDRDSLREILRLARAGARIVMKRRPREPGHIKWAGYELQLDELPDITLEVFSPLLSGENIPPYWARSAGEDLLLFFAHPLAKQIRYPMPYQMAREAVETNRDLILHWNGREIRLPLHFEPNGSVAVLVKPEGAVEQLLSFAAPDKLKKQNG